jgi:hypothetical protein
MFNVQKFLHCTFIRLFLSIHENNCRIILSALQLSVVSVLLLGKLSINKKNSNYNIRAILVSSFILIGTNAFMEFVHRPEFFSLT